jgi:hypothetical protein
MWRISRRLKPNSYQTHQRKTDRLIPHSCQTWSPPDATIGATVVSFVSFAAGVATVGTSVALYRTNGAPVQSSVTDIDCYIRSRLLLPSSSPPPSRFSIQSVTYLCVITHFTSLSLASVVSVMLDIRLEVEIWFPWSLYYLYKQFHRRRVFFNL